ncbi:DUF2963 domain-containing protein [Candidatus Phytoplasma sp. AldY-WA1]|uniref:DUF2963 domain-containing protein n=1 Tax=Candidatus Phytoplasma sp. AldY-WA1 TaxID=2852100 RepID=UPI00254C2832|nr:DUF2963 domain-containing protein [Candidatus Phytoplasma sp. AldY-WA1]
MKLKQFFNNIKIMYKIYKFIRYNKKIILTIISVLILIITTYFIYDYNKKDLKKAEYDVEELKDDEDEDVFENSVTSKTSIIEPKVVNPNLIKNEEKKPKIFYRPDGKTVRKIEEYNKNGQKTKEKFYQPDGKTIMFIDEYNENEKLVKRTSYQNDGKTIIFINKYNENEKLVKMTSYRNDGKTISFIVEYNENGQETKTTWY